MESTKTAIVCLGKSFENDDERREYFREELRKKLPELKNIEGFPQGEDEDIVNLSDPPYYTACPNPWLNDFIEEWESNKNKAPGRLKHFNVTEPYASDVSEGKTNQIYAAHSYHTKVPHPAIMRYILHYTQPGDIIFDGFAGTGMTAVAALSCSNPDVDDKFKIDSEWKKIFDASPNWGNRKAIVGDLSPVASFISYNYTIPYDIDNYVGAIQKIIKEFDKELSWMYETNHTNGKKGRINFVVWSEVMSCPNCNHEFNFTEAFYNPSNQSVADEIKCSSCSTILNKESCTLMFETILDKGVNSVIRRPKRVPVEISYNYGGEKYSKKPDKGDLQILQRIEELPFPENAPNFKLPDMQMVRVGRIKTTNIEYVHQFFVYRALQSLAFFWKKAQESKDDRISSFLLFTIEQMVWGISLLNRFRPTGFSQVNQFLSGVFYVASHVAEINPLYLLPVWPRDSDIIRIEK
ncbi:MAG: hypothetical protein EOO85_07650 [Pedobacter sp.]|nr:MAG: hypothetical protein EOO85_07650 [Pedobacter sp.]